MKTGTYRKCTIYGHFNEPKFISQFNLKGTVLDTLTVDVPVGKTAAVVFEAKDRIFNEFRHKVETIGDQPVTKLGENKVAIDIRKAVVMISPNIPYEPIIPNERDYSLTLEAISGDSQRQFNGKEIGDTEFHYLGKYVSPTGYHNGWYIFQPAQ